MGLFLIGPYSHANPDTPFSSKTIAESIRPFQNISEKELIEQFNANIKDSRVAPFLKKYPLATVFMVRLIQDKTALPSLAKIIENKERLITYSYWMLGTFVFAFILRRMLKIDNAGFFEAIALWFFRFFVMLFIRLGLTYYFFSNEFEPTFKVIMRTFF
jgi:hypothetical protein